MSRVVKWQEDMGEDRLWVCQSCGAELDADCVGETCPVCHNPAADDEDAITPDQSHCEPHNPYWSAAYDCARTRSTLV